MTPDMKYHLRHVTKWLKPRWEFVSYPKCGRTWLRFMMGNLFNEFFELELDNDDMLELKKKVHYRDLRIPYISMHHDGYVHKRPHRRRALTPNGTRVSGSSSSCATPPRDVVVSSFHQLSKRDRLGGRRPVGLHPRRHHRPAAHRGLLQRLDANIDCTHQHIIVRYEDLKTDTFGELRRLLSALDMEYIPDDFPQKAIEMADFKRMQKMEKKGRFHTGQDASRAIQRCPDLQGPQGQGRRLQRGVRPG